MSDYESKEYDTNFEKRQIAWQFGCTVTLVRPGLVVKQGAKVRPSEERAMRLMKEHAPEVPIPNIHGSLYRYKGGVPFYGELSMDFVPGRTLKLA
ncbi:hypothetical protein J3458_020672 [Metarhizium acridum]|uniref:uncharacterized protein n=1 Tax=Metarhizium acridum TaxID=92637 RepID=UPI001C6C86F2|nr:hypothetical protein J3458_020672 [Metarhizium acridum]